MPGSCCTWAARCRFKGSKEGHKILAQIFDRFSSMQVIMIYAAIVCLALLVARCECSFYGMAAPREDHKNRYRYVSLASSENSAVEEGSGAVIRPSPECWKSAMTAFYLNTTPLSENDAKIFCQHMHEDHQKVLALMISQCHLEDLGKALMEDPVVLQDCLQRAATSRDVLLACLKRLTDAGVTAYTHYVAYVQQFCTRLTQELAVQLQVEAHKVMAQRYEQLSNESLQQLESIQSWQTTFLETFSQSFEREMQLQLRVRLPETLKNQVDQVMRYHASEQTRMVEDLMAQLKERQSEQEERQEAWLSQKVNLVQRYVEELEHQHEKLRDQQSKIDSLSETIASVAHDVMPFAGLHRLVGVVTNGYTWVMLALRTVVGLCLLRFVTRPKRFQPSRSYLFTLLLLETIAEASLWALTRYEWMLEAERHGWVARLRHWTLVLIGVAYCASFLLSFYRPKVDEKNKNQSLSTLKLELDELRQQHNQMLSNWNSEKLVMQVNDRGAAPRATSVSPVIGRLSHETTSAYTHPDWPQNLNLTTPHHLKPRLAPQFLTYNPRSVEIHGLEFERRSTPEVAYRAGGDAYSSFASLPASYPRSQGPVPVSHVPDHRHWLPVYPPSPVPNASVHFTNSNLTEAPVLVPRGRVDVASPTKAEATMHPPVPAWTEMSTANTAAEPHPGSPHDTLVIRKKREADEIATDRPGKKSRIDIECEVPEEDP